MNRLFTVLVLSYNNLQYIEACLNSIFNQNYPYIEIIISDDSSTNFDFSKIENYINTNKKENIINFKINRNEENLGIVKNLNRAIQLGSGDYFMNLACDDMIYDENVISDLVKYLDESNYLITTGYLEINDPKMSMSRGTYPSKNHRDLVLNSKPIDIYKSLCKKNFLTGPGVTYKKELIEKYGLYDETYRLSENYPRYLYLTRNGCPIGFIDRHIIKYRFGVGVSSKSIFSNNNSAKLQLMKDNELIRNREISPYIGKI